MSKRKRTTRRRSLRVRIYELRNYILDKLELIDDEQHSDNIAASHMVEILNELGDLFDIKNMQKSYELYLETTEVLDKPVKKQIPINAEPTREEIMQNLRRMFNIK